MKPLDFQALPATTDPRVKAAIEKVKAWAKEVQMEHDALVARIAALEKK